MTRAQIVAVGAIIDRVMSACQLAQPKFDGTNVIWSRQRRNGRTKRKNQPG
jgi:hypothetical protein